MHTWKDAEEVVTEIGGNEWGMRELAEQALDEAQSYARKGDDPLIVTWSVFLELLDIYGKTEAAFEAAIRDSPVYNYLRKRLPTEEDAMDVAQNIFIGLWRSFMRFVPTSKKSWRSFQFMSARRKLNTYLERNIYRIPDFVELREDHAITVIEEDGERAIAVRTVCRRWIEGRHQRKAIMAAEIMAMLNNEAEYIPLTGKKMADRCSAVPSSLHTWLKEFVSEVLDESKSR